MRPYWSLFATRARTLFQYRVAALAGLATQWVFGFVLTSVLVAFYGSTAAAQPMSLAQSITYTWLGQALLGILPWNFDREIGDGVRTGAVAYDLARPIDLYAYWYARVMAMRVAPTLLKSIPMFLIATFLMPAPFTMQWPQLPALLAWLTSLLGALLLSCAITLLMQVSLFWTVTGDGITRILPHIVTLFSGMVIPLPLFPDWLQGFLRFQPFTGVSATPSMLFTGVLPPSAIWETLALQLGWTLVFVSIGRLIMRRGLLKLTVAGG